MKRLYLGVFVLYYHSLLLASKGQRNMKGLPSNFLSNTPNLRLFSLCGVCRHKEDYSGYLGTFQQRYLVSALLRSYSSNRWVIKGAAIVKVQSPPSWLTTLGEWKIWPYQHDGIRGADTLTRGTSNTVMYNLLNEIVN